MANHALASPKMYRYIDNVINGAAGMAASDVERLFEKVQVPTNLMISLEQEQSKIPDVSLKVKINIRISRVLCIWMSKNRTILLFQFSLKFKD